MIQHIFYTPSSDTLVRIPYSPARRYHGHYIGYIALGTSLSLLDSADRTETLRTLIAMSRGRTPSNSMSRVARTFIASATPVPVSAGLAFGCFRLLYWIHFLVLAISARNRLLSLRSLCLVVSLCLVTYLSPPCSFSCLTSGRCFSCHHGFGRYDSVEEWRGSQRVPAEHHLQYYCRRTRGSSSTAYRPPFDAFSTGL